MHVALEVHDVLVSLFEILLAQNDKGVALARLARTCRAYKDPALRILWRELDSLEPLAALLPFQKGDPKPYLGNLLRHPTTLEKENFAMYAQYVRVIRIQTWTPWLSVVMKDLYYNIDFTCLLPNLQTLIWLPSPDAPDCNDAIRFLSPALASLTISSTPGPVNRILEYLSKHCKELRTLRINNQRGVFGFPLPGDILPSTHTSKLLHLNSIYFDSGNHAVGWVELQSLPHLTTLSLGSQEVPLATVAKTVHTSGFLSLRNLSIASPIFIAESVVRSLPSTPLEGVSAIVPSTSFAKTEDLQNLFTSLATNHKPSLRSLKIESWTSNVHIGSDLLLLLGFPQLARLEFAGSEHLNINDATLRDLASGLPNLERLWLTPRLLGPKTFAFGRAQGGGVEAFRFGPANPAPSDGQSLRITLDGLISILQYCRSIRSLGLAINCKGANTADPGASFISSALTDLDVGVSIIDDAIGVAALLSRLVPVLDSFSWTSGKDDRGYSEKCSNEWALVWRLYPTMVAVRKDERKNVA